MDFPMLDNNGTFCTADLFTVDVELETKRMVQANLDSDQISASDALTLVWFHTISAGHVKLHAYGNWGVRTKAGVDVSSKELANNSVVTVLYNYFGYTLFPRLCSYFVHMGITKYDFGNITEVFDHGIYEGILSHSHIREIAKYSKVAKFIIGVRNCFMQEFDKRKNVEFENVNGEALFIGTVLHSLDHSFMGLTLRDPLWLDVESPRFGLMASLGRIVRAGFVEDIPTVGVAKH